MSALWNSISTLWHSKRDTKAPVHDKLLPVELWSMIIDLIMAEIRHPYLYCRPETFPFFLMRHYYTEDLEKDTILDDWNNIRAVCKTWKRLAGHRPHLRLNTIHASIDDLPEGVTSLFTGLYEDEPSFLRQLIQNPTTCSNLTTLALSHRFSPRNNATEILLDNARLFPSLRCLSLWSIRIKRPFWEVLQNEFPRLVALTIRHYSGDCTGSYTLWSLEILDINGWTGVRLTCPSIKHVCIRQNVSEEAEEFLREHSYQLESCLLDSYLRLKFTRPLSRFWSPFPNLVALGKKPRDNPCVEAAIRHLCIFKWHTPVEVDLLLSEIELYPSITHVHIQTECLTKNSLGRFRTRCRERNIEVVELPKVRMPYLDKPPRTLGSYCSEVGSCILFCPIWLCLIVCRQPLRGAVPR
ncbi:hypothetical protein FRB91_000855 [Serendipita sp. 411]|nr:hypothetical protein FRB91_000855 [Serendipita sp. 411]